MNRLWACGVAAALGLALACATVQALEIPITVEEPAGIARTAEPVSGGIPLPWGRFKKDQPFALFDGAKQVPLQALPLVVDEKGFLRWILIDFQTDLGAKQKKTFTLKTVAGSARPAKAVTVTQDAAGVTVDTGAVTLLISKIKPFGLFDSVTAGGRSVVGGGEVSYTDGFDGTRYAAGKPTSVEVEYAGPMRTTVAVKGRFVGDEQSKLQYIARITAWAGRSDVFVKYTLANSNPDHYCYRAVKDSSVTLRLGAAAPGAVVGAGNPLEVRGDAWLKQGLYAAYAGGGKAGSSEGEVWSSTGKGDVAQGWIRTSGPANVQVTDILFTADPARRLAVSGDRLTLTGITERYEGQKDDRGRLRGVPYAATVRALPDCSHHSSQYLIDFQASTSNPANTDQAERARNRIWAMAPPAWYFETEGLSVGTFGTQADELACYKTWGWEYDPKRVPTAPGRTYGRFIRGEDNHYETEEDIVESLLLMYLRTGRRSFFENCRSWAEYNIDMQAWRTDGWRYKDGGVWWYSGPYGNRPQRAADPVTGNRNGIPAPWTKNLKAPWTKDLVADFYFLCRAKACYCHNWGEGLVGWFCITGDRDALEAAIDIVEQNIDTQRRAFKKVPGKVSTFSRDFTRSCYLTNSTRMVVPNDPFVVEASEYLMRIFFERPVKGPRGLVNGAQPLTMRGFGAIPKLDQLVGKGGLAKMKELGVTMSQKDGKLTDPKTGNSWYPIVKPNIWMFPPMSQAMESYYKITGSENAMDWTIAYGQAVSHVIYQRHGNLHGSLIADFPLRGIARDHASWNTPEDNKYAEGVKMSGYLARFHPDAAARAYSLCGEPMLKQRAHDYWFAGSHRGYHATKMHNLGRVGSWVNYYGPHSEYVNFTGRTFYEWAHPRKDAKAPAAVAGLRAVVAGEKATVTFAAPPDQGGGKVARYQVKCSDRPIVDYEAFLKAFNKHEDKAVTNWWMAANLNGEPAPGGSGAAERFTVTGVPEGAKYFAIRSFDDSNNRSALSNLATAR